MTQTPQVEALEATKLGGGTYAVRPVGALGTCGWIGGTAWTVRYVTARNATAAIAKARYLGGCFSKA